MIRNFDESSVGRVQGDILKAGVSCSGNTGRSRNHVVTLETMVWIGISQIEND